jgi:hypothetical protein
MIAAFIGGPMDGKTQELPLNSDGLPPAEIPCEVRDAGELNWNEPVEEQLERGELFKTLKYIRTVNPRDEGPLVLYIADDPADWEPESE